MVCRCKNYFNISEFAFIKDRTYRYDIFEHVQEEEEPPIITILYMVYIGEYPIPFTKTRFLDNFDNRIEIRDKMINQILGENNFKE